MSGFMSHKPNPRQESEGGWEGGGGWDALSELSDPDGEGWGARVMLLIQKA